MERKYKLGYCMAVLDYRIFAQHIWLKSIMQQREELISGISDEYMGVLDRRVLEQYLWIEEAARKCEKFVLGIPDEWIVARLFGDEFVYSTEEAKRCLLYSDFISDVVVLDAEHLFYQEIYKQVPFDVCFYGSEYGIWFEKDRIFMKENRIAFLSLQPDNYVFARDADALKLALENVQRHEKIILIGTGECLETYRQEYAANYKPSLVIDTKELNEDLTNEQVEENRNSSPAQPWDNLLKEDYKNTIVILCNRDYQEALLRLKGIGDFNYRTMLYQNEVALLEEFAISAAGERAYLERAHIILTELLKELDRVCLKYNLHYYIVFGSLIGVVRHHDFIPWDDDIDIAMPRKDFKLLQKVAKKEWNNETFLFVNYDKLGNGVFHDFIPRLIYMKEHLPTKAFRKAEGRSSLDIADRIFMDFFVMDNAHENLKAHYATMTVMKGIYNLCMGHRGVIDYEEYKKKLLPDNMIALMKKLHAIGKILPLRLLFFFYELFGQSANLSKKCKYYYMGGCPITIIERLFDKSFFGEGIRMPHGKIEVTVPEDYDRLLKIMYYNYMQLPRLSERKPSHYFNSDIEIGYYTGKIINS